MGSDQPAAQSEPWLCPGTALVEELDRRLLVQLRDGRKIVGVLRSFDQFANLVLEGAIERIVVGTLYCELPLGLFIIRGENVVLLGEIDPAKCVCVAARRVCADCTRGIGRLGRS